MTLLADGRFTLQSAQQKAGDRLASGNSPTRDDRGERVLLGTWRIYQGELILDTQEERTTLDGAPLVREHSQRIAGRIRMLPLQFEFHIDHAGVVFQPAGANRRRVLRKTARAVLLVLAGLAAVVMLITGFSRFFAHLRFPLDPWNPEPGELGGAFLLSIVALGIGGLLFTAANRASRPGVVSLGVSRIWAFGLLLGLSGVVLLFRMAWLSAF